MVLIFLVTLARFCTNFSVKPDRLHLISKIFMNELGISVRCGIFFKKNMRKKNRKIKGPLWVEKVNIFTWPYYTYCFISISAPWIAQSILSSVSHKIKKLQLRKANMDWMDWNCEWNSGRRYCYATPEYTLTFPSQFQHIPAKKKWLWLFSSFFWIGWRVD